MLSDVFTCKSDQFHSFIRLNKVIKKKEILVPDYMECKKKLNFTSRGRSNRSTVFLSFSLPANMSKHQNTL